MRLRSSASVFCVLNIIVGLSHGKSKFSNEFVIEVNGGEELAKNISKDYGLQFVSAVFPDEDFYILVHKGVPRRSKRSAHQCCKQLESDWRVKWVEQQVYHKREKREILSFESGPQSGSEGKLFPTLLYNTARNDDVTKHSKPRDRNTYINNKYNLQQKRNIAISSATEEQTQERSSNVLSGGLPISDTRGIINNKAAEVPQIRLEDNALYERHIAEFQKKDHLVTEDMDFNDPYYPDQWYLNNYGQMGTSPGHDINVLPAWKNGYTGEGIIVSVLDDGIQHTNKDIQDNYEPSVSYDLVSQEGDPDPMPNLSNDNDYHGTFCAAIIAAVANNSVCGVGVAYRAKVGGVRLLPDEGMVRDVDEAAALSQAVDLVHIYSASWGPKDDGKHVAGPGRLAAKALQKGVEKGRDGKGVIYIWAVGNGGASGDNCNLDGYSSSIFTLSVCALTYSGLTPYYGEPCASTLACTYVGGAHNSPMGEDEAERERRKIKVVVPELNGGCRESFQGTSAAAPMAAGIVAVVLQANPELTWRDVQHIVVQTSRRRGNEAGWKRNGAGHDYHLLQGFGAMDTAAMVEAAKTWTNVPPVRTVTVQGREIPVSLQMNQNTSLPIHVHWYVMQGPGEKISRLEYVVATVSISHRRRGQIELFLTSPAGTDSQLLTLRQHDHQTSGFSNWDFVSAHFWGEDPTGVWTFTVSDHSGTAGTLDYLNLTFTGT